MRSGKVSLKPLTPLLVTGAVISFPAYILLDASSGNRFLRSVFDAIFYTCWILLLYIRQWYATDKITPPDNKWYTPWRSATFSMREGAMIKVGDIDAASSWYAAKLGLRRQAELLGGRTELAVLKFKPDGKRVVLASDALVLTDKRLILFTKKIDRMKQVLFARGAEVGPIECDRQGTRYFEIYDPDGNSIEITQDI